MIQNETSEWRKTDKERVKQKNVKTILKIFAGSENFQGGHRKSFTC